MDQEADEYIAELENAHGIALSEEEFVAFAQALEAGESPEVVEAAFADRRVWMLERYQAGQSPEADEDRLYDLDNKKDRVDLMVERYTNGTEFEDVEVPADNEAA
jgi:hypothetical protein